MSDLMWNLLGKIICCDLGSFNFGASVGSKKLESTIVIKLNLAKWVLNEIEEYWMILIAYTPTAPAFVWMSTKGEHLQKWPPRRLLKFLPNWKKGQSTRKKLLFCPPGHWGAQKSFSSSRDMKNYDLGWILFFAFQTLRNYWILLSLPQKVSWDYSNESKLQ